MIQVDEKYDIMDLYRVSNGRTVRVNSWEFIVGDGTDSSVQFVTLAEGGEFYPAND